MRAHRLGEGPACWLWAEGPSSRAAAQGAGRGRDAAPPAGGTGCLGWPVGGGLSMRDDAFGGAVSRRRGPQTQGRGRLAWEGWARGPRGSTEGPRGHTLAGGGLSPAEAGRWERERGDEREAELRELGPAAQGERTSLAPRAPLPSSRGGDSARAGRPRPAGGGCEESGRLQGWTQPHRGRAAASGGSRIVGEGPTGGGGERGRASQGGGWPSLVCGRGCRPSSCIRPRAGGLPLCAPHSGRAVASPRSVPSSPGRGCANP